jgi:hypothetical protein
MLQRVAIWLLLLLILGTPRGNAHAEPGRPTARARTDSVAVVRGESPSALERSEDAFLPFAGKPVGRIRVRSLDVFGTSIDDTTMLSTSWLTRILNSLNFRTRPATVRRSLLFRQGDLIDPFRVAESERILRNLPFIRDARIVLGRNPGGSDSVNVLVIVRESWTLMLSGSPTDPSGLKGSLTEQNLYGLGHEVSGSVTVIKHVRPRYDVSYSVQNIRGTFVNGQLRHLSMPTEKTTTFKLSRDLVSSVLGYAGGLDLGRSSITATDTLTGPASNAFSRVDLWAGKVFHLGSGQQGIIRGRVLLVTGRILRVKFSSRPPVTPSSLEQYHDVSYFLGGLALMQSRYYRTSLLYSFGQVEDIPYGFRVRVAYGLSDEQFSRTSYASAGLAAGQKVKGLGYGVGDVRIGGNPGSGRIARGVIRVRTLYFSNLTHAGRYRFRQFFSAEYITGFHRPADDSIDFNGDDGIRGVTYNGAVIGSKRVRLGFESVTFAPWKPQAVAFAFFTFADLDIIGSGSRSVFSQEYYSGLGVGVRLYREAFGFGPVQLRFAWYPRLPVEHADYAYTLLGEKRFRKVEFLGGKPDIVEY